MMVDSSLGLLEKCAAGGKRWPRDETLALLKIRSAMDTQFRDSNSKAPLWDEISRKLGELGYHRGAKKCKEKFENVYKYHRRTKEGRSGHQSGKNYRFFEQLELLDSQSSLPLSPSNNVTQNITTPPPTTKELTIKAVGDDNHDFTIPSSTQNRSFELVSTSTSAASSEGNAKKKRKLEGYFETVMKKILDRQENLQNKFIEAIEKSETDRIAREEAWRANEFARVKKEREILSQERAIAAAKDAAVIAFLQKISEQANPIHQSEKTEFESGANLNRASFSSSRWPKAEVEALVSLRTNTNLQHYKDNGAKSPLWVNISLAMNNLGYTRSSKKCKEKWENINKYYKRVKESNKKRPEDSKTCPYFSLLESIYEKKLKNVDNPDSLGYNMKPEEILMQMISNQQQESATQHEESENVDKNQEEDDDDDDDDDDDEDEDDNGDDYQIVANNPSLATME